MTKNKNILFLTISGRKGASSRYRVYQFLPYLEGAGYAAAVMPPQVGSRGIGGLLARRREEAAYIDAASRSDVIVIQKRLFNTGFISRLRRLGKPIVFDFDDSIFTSPSGDWSIFSRSKVARRLKCVLRSADLVLAGNRFLAGHAESRGAKVVDVLPTAVDVSGYRAKLHKSGQATFGWIGSSVNHRYLDMLSGVLGRLAGELPDMKLLVVSDRDYGMDGVYVENRRWSEATELDDLLDMDIGLMPLSDDDWTRGKCALKALQYLACGIPAVCSPVGANVEVISPGIEGFLPADESDWFNALLELSSDHEKRNAMGTAGIAKVSRDYSLEAVSRRLKDLLDRL